MTRDRFHSFVIIVFVLFCAAHTSCTQRLPPPSVQIDSPANGAQFVQGQSVTLRGTVNSPQTQDLPEWSIDGRSLGAGTIASIGSQQGGSFTSTVILETANETPGAHAIRFQSRVTESGPVAFAERSITILAEMEGEGEGEGEGESEGMGEGMGEGQSEGEGETETHVFVQGEDGYDGFDDTTIYMERPASAGGGIDGFFAGTIRTGEIRRGLIRADLSAIPAGSEVVSVRLELTVSRSGENSTEGTYGLHRALNDWGEGTVDVPDDNQGGFGAPANDGDATWVSNFHNQSSWTNVGGDFIAKASGLAPAMQEGSTAIWIDDGLIDDVQAWVNDPDANFGWFVVSAIEGTIVQRSQKYYSSESDTGRPRLTIVTLPEEGPLASFETVLASDTSELTFSHAVERVSSRKQGALSDFIAVGTEFPTESTESFVYLARIDGRGELIERISGGMSSNDLGAALALTNDGGWNLMGTAFSSTTLALNAYLERFNALGESQYVSTFGGNAQAITFDADRVADDGVIIAADRNENDVVTALLIRVMPDGNTQWERVFSGIDGVALNVDAVAALPDGTFAAAGFVEDPDSSSVKAHVIRVAANGDLMWQFDYGTETADEEGLAICATGDGVLLAGVQRSVGQMADIYVVRIDNDGNVVWSNTYGATGQEEAHDVIRTSNGEFAIAGTAPSAGGSDRDMYLLRIDGTGAVVYERLYGGDGDDQAFGIEQTSEGGFLLAGTTFSFGNEARGAAYLVKTDADGNLDAR